MHFKKIIQIGIILFISFIVAKTAEAAITLRPPLNLGLVGYWSFDEGSGAVAGDASGNGKNGTISGASWTDGKRGQALSFNGTNNYVDAGNVGSGVKTISFWIKADSVTNKILKLANGANIEVVSGTITTSGITSPTIYVDGSVSSTIDIGWHYVTITTGTNINASGTKFGYITPWACGDTLTDTRDSKNYATVQIGSQCWMKQGLNVGTRIVGTSDQGTNCSSSSAIQKYCYSDNDAYCDSNNNPNYPDGGLYQWDQMMCGSATEGARGICPTGWHIPTDAEQYALEDYLKDSGQTCNASRIGYDCPTAGTKLKPNGSSGFEGNLAGYRDGTNGSIFYRGTYGNFWSSSVNAPYGLFRQLYPSNNQVYRTYDSKSGGYSVRCLQDTAPSYSYFSGKLDEVRMYNRELGSAEVTTLYQAGAVKYSAPNNTGLVGYWAMEENTGTQAGDSSGNNKNGTISGATWTDGKRGRALSFDGTNNYVDAGNVYNGVKTISFWFKADAITSPVINLSGTAKIELSSGTIITNGITSPTIYVDGTVSSTVDTNWHYVTVTSATGIDASATNFGKPPWVCGDALVDSRDSKSYATVQVGTQCWMKQGLNVGTRVNGGITQDGYSGTTCSTIKKYCYSDTDANCDSNNNPNYPDGGLYQWNQMMCGSTTEGAQGICPTGWHIPSDAEQFTLENYVKSNGASCDSARYGIWDCNGAGFALMPNGSSGWEGNTAGQFSGGGFYYRANYGYFWSSAPGGSRGTIRQLNSAWNQVNRDIDWKVNGNSVRCLKDSQTPYFSGKLDEVRMYNRELSATEVAGLYQASGRKITVNSSQNSLVTDGLVGLWSFNGSDISGSTVIDKSGNGKNGTITGAAATIGKVGQAINFNGTSDSIDLGNVYNGVKSVTFWVKTEDTSDNGYFGGKLDEVRYYNRELTAAEVKQLYGGGSSAALTSVRPNTKMLALNSTVGVKAVSGTVTAKGFTSPTIYVDGTAATTIDDNWRFVAVTTGTGINAATSTLGLGPVWECGDTLTYCGDNYTTVQMSATYGSQCWLQENLRNTTKPDCTTGITSYCNPSGCSSPWGRLYDWNTAMNGAAASTGCGAKIQGICPNGWHIPSAYLGCPSDDFYGLGSDGGALKLTGTFGIDGEWLSPNTGATNASNWTAYPAGYNGGARYSWGYFWSSSDAGASYGVSSCLRYNQATFVINCGGFKTDTMSVRCVKD